ncbi:MAG TPA: bifunctional UDP-N-acetylglucosamine diphosphorylase/glucosamine-1-phosphate N-acetyltransferase GlmU [Aggregatilineales bacterium]|nr:bifunctional UDP-N-acetylglucosamine diphosphorylase/glucosamine-1-phosphate N-acetyltransferase GlmU [Aggregatilineales bacterium]
MSSVSVVILAAGQGTRMKSDLAKVLHRVGGKSMILRSVDTASRLADEPPVVVVGRDADAVRQSLGSRARYVTQAPLLGTGHAVMQTADVLRSQGGIVAVFHADLPLLRAETLARLVEVQMSDPASVITLLSVIAPDPRGFGRLIRDRAGHILANVEERDCTPEQRQIHELNVGAYAFDAAWLWDNLSRLQVKSNGEYYLTDLIHAASESGRIVNGVECEDLDEVIGVNTRVHLSEAEAALRRRLTRHWMLEGVTILDPMTTYIQEDVTIGQDTLIYPNTHLMGKTAIGANSIIGPNSILVDSRIGAFCTVEYSVVERAVLEDHVEIGPFSHLRTGAYLAEGVHMGNFGEVKNSRLGPKTRMGHFSYIGDAQVGEDVNIGAGTITANFDGERKHQTVIGDHAFIGSDTILRAPVTVEANAKTAAGSVVTHDVPSGYISIGVPGRLRELKPKEDTVDGA